MFATNNRLRILLAAAILIPVLLYWGFSGSPGELANRSPSTLSEEMDYFINNATITEWGVKGELKSTLNTVRLEHSPQLLSSQLTNPINYRYSEGKPPTRVTSDTGITLDDNSRTDLVGNVRVNDNPHSQTGTVMTTETLSIFTKEDYATSSDRVTITSPNGMQTGIGMHTDFNSRTMTLHSKVEGRYDNNK